MKSAFINPRRESGIRFLGVWICLWCGGCLQAERSNPIHNSLSSLPIRRLEILRPDGAEQWYVGTEHQIMWDPGDQAADTTVSLRLSADGGQTYPHSIADDIPNTGGFVWQIPDLPSKQCRIQIIGADSLDASDAVFAILRKPVPRQVTFQGGEWPSWRDDLLAFMSDRAGNYDIWVIEAPHLVQVTTSTANDRYPAFDKKGFHLAFASDRSGSEQIWATARFVTGSDPTPVQLTTIGGTQPGWQQLPAARRLVFISLFRGAMNVATLDFSMPLTPASLISAPRFRVKNGPKERPSWIIDSSNEPYIYYKDLRLNAGSSAINRVRIGDGYEDAPANIPLPFTSPTRNPAVSPSVTKLAVNMDGDIWVVPIKKGRPVGDPLQITFDPADDDVPDWRSDTELAFQSNRTGRWEIWTVELP